MKIGLIAVIVAIIAIFIAHKLSPKPKSNQSVDEAKKLFK